MDMEDDEENEMQTVSFEIATGHLESLQRRFIHFVHHGANIYYRVNIYNLYTGTSL